MAETVHYRGKAERIADRLRKRILDGKYPETGRFPSSRVLAEEFSVSLRTADKALHILTEEGLLQRKSGSGTRLKCKTHFRIACFFGTDFSRFTPQQYSDVPFFLAALITELQKRDFEYRFFSVPDLKKRYFSNRILDGFDGLLVSTTYNDIATRQLIADFKGPKVWIDGNTVTDNPGSQIVFDFHSGFIEMFQEARKQKMKKCIIHYFRPLFRDIMVQAAELSGWSSSEYEVREVPEGNKQIPSFRYGLDLEAASDLLHVCDTDMMACGIYQAMRERKLNPGEFALTGNGNIERFGYLPLGEPCLTTMGTPTDLRAKSAVDILVKHMQDKTLLPEIVRLPRNLVIRKSAFAKQTTLTKG